MGMVGIDGRSKVWDSSADGMVRAEGVGAFILGLLFEVHRCNYSRVARLVGIATNQDGKSASMTAPSGPAQHRLLEAVWYGLAAQPGSRCSFEIHGTGTPLGDPIEANALKTSLDGPVLRLAL